MLQEQLAKFNNLLEELRSGFYMSDSIDLTSYRITDDELKELLAGIKIHSGINKQIRVLNLTDHNLNFASIEGLTGLEELILNNKITQRRTTLELINLPHLTKLQARLCNLIWLTFYNITTLKSVDLFLNDLKEIDLDAQVGLTDLILYSNRFKKLDFSALHKLKKLDIGSNEIQELYLGNSPLSTEFSFKSTSMSENSKKQLWARYITNSEQMNDYDNSGDGNNLERTAEIKDTIRIKEVTDLAECFTAHISELRNHELKKWMWDAQRTYAYCQVRAAQDLQDWNRIPDVIQIKIITESLYGLIYKLHHRLHAVLEQFESVVPELTMTFIKDRVDPFIEACARDVIKNFGRPKFKAALVRLIRDNLNLQEPMIIQTPVVIQEPVRTTEQQSQSTTGCLSLPCLPNIRPITWLASGFKSAAQQGAKQLTPKFRKKYAI